MNASLLIYRASNSGDFIPDPDSRLIVKEVCSLFMVTHSMLKSKRRHKAYTEPRHFISFFIKHFTQCSDYSAGELVNRDRTTVYASYHHILNLLSSDKITVAHFEHLRSKIVPHLSNQKLVKYQLSELPISQ